VCTEFIIDISCRTDDDCQLINKDLRFSCCWAGACESIDYRENKWIAVNKNWFRAEKKKNCPTVEECGPAPLCAVRAINEDFTAKCIDQVCQKVPLIPGEPSLKGVKCCLLAKGLCQIIVEPSQCRTGRVVDCSSIICNPKVL